MLLWIVVTLQGIAILSLLIGLKIHREVIETIFEFISKTHPYELSKFLGERNRRKGKKESEKK